MSDLKQWAAVNNDTVVHGFDAPQDLIDHFQERIVEPLGVTTPDWYAEGITEFVDVTGLEPRPVEGFVTGKKGNWIAPEQPAPPVVTAEQRAAADQRADDDAFIEGAVAKVRADEELTQSERDRLMVLQLERTITAVS